MDLNGKVAVVTGAASGIGRSVALAAARRGANVVAADIDAAGLEQAGKEITALGRSVLTVQCDVTSDAAVAALAERAVGWQGHVDLLMNNAGAAVGGPIELLSLADWEWQLQLNLFGVIRGIHAFLPHFIARGSGTIVNTASVAGLSGSAVLAAYTTSKHAVVGLSEALANYLRPRGIQVSVLCPDAINTQIWDRVRWAEGLSPEHGSALGRARDAMRSPDEVAETLFGALDEDRFVVLTAPTGSNPLIEARAAAIEAMVPRTAATPVAGAVR